MDGRMPARADAASVVELQIIVGDDDPITGVAGVLGASEVRDVLDHAQGEGVKEALAHWEQQAAGGTLTMTDQEGNRLLPPQPFPVGDVSTVIVTIQGQGE